MGSELQQLLTAWQGRLKHFLLSDRLMDFALGLLLLLAGWLLARALRSALMRSLPGRFTRHQRQIWARGIYYSVLLIFIASALHQMGFKLSIFLGAAGILTVALGFASQTSASNLISGLFLIGEGSFAIGDMILVGDIQGEVLAIDLLSIKLRTLDNLYIRIPNEHLIKTPLTNLTRFAIRRVPVTLAIGHHEDIAKVRRILLAVADAYPLVLTEPRPIVTMQRFAESSFEVLFAVWTARENFLTVRDEIHERIQSAFVRENINIPLPAMTINPAQPAPAAMVTAASMPVDGATPPTR